MAPRTGRPHSDNPKILSTRIRLSEADIEKLDYSCKALGITKAEIIRQGIEKMYKVALKK
ncbi:MAG: hypothetical protein K0Q87_1711 [Neobacillus sp.]|jgi:predicted DNA-binding protein|nr:hypothetical protein [Neobacillus sp.]